MFHKLAEAEEEIHKNNACLMKQNTVIPLTSLFQVGINLAIDPLLTLAAQFTPLNISSTTSNSVTQQNRTWQRLKEVEHC